jgi:transglycosylase-like protein with SLT domain
MALPYLACMVLAARLYALPPRVLPSIQAVEGGRPGSVSRNRDGSEDLGVMQVTTRWIPALAAQARMPADVVRWRLINEPCFNIVSAGAIMRLYLDETRGDLLRAVGNYHSHTEPLNRQYQLQVLRAARLLFQHGTQ